MKKVLSIILAMVMLTAMLPAAFATESDSSEFTGYKYVFTSEALPDELKNSSKYVLIDKFENSTTDTPISSVSAPWKIASHFYVKNIQARPASGLSGSTTYTGFNVWTDTSKSHTYFAIEIKVGKGGTYVPSLKYFETELAPKVKIWLVKGGTTSNNVNTSEFAYQPKASTGSDRYMTLYNYASKLGDGGVDKHLLTKELDMYGEFKQGNPPATQTFDELTLESGSYFLIFHKTGSVLQPGADGNTKDLQFSLDSLTLTPVQDEKLTEAFKPENSVTEENYNEPVVITVSKDGIDNITSIKNSDGTHNITAPETNRNGKKFLYWAKGLSTQKRILIGKTNELLNYAPDSEYANYLIPVYEDEVSGVEYYNANGQLVGTNTEPGLPSMAGYGVAKEWKKYGETNIHVAHYELAEPEKNIAITVNNGTGTGTYAFGDKVTCTANGTGTFKCWTKTGINGEIEIVSCDSTYTFKAWEGCTVDAVYEDHHYTGTVSKIIVDSFIAGNETGVMAEFVGLDNAVEKGIMFTDSDENTTKIAMTTKDSQFTVIADKAGTYKGYAIIKENDGSYTLITDGAYEHTK